MRLIHPNALAVAATPSLASSEGPELTIVVKGTYRLVPDGAAEPADEPHPPTGDTFEDADPGRPLRYPNDFVPFKPGADLLLVGTAHAPGGAPVTDLPVGFSVGTARRILTVSGDREWTGRLVGRRRPSEPQPFVSMPLGYDRSFGGPSLAENPLGLGGEDTLDDLGRRRRPLPNIQDPASPLRGPTSRVEPVGLGPIPETWPQRSSRLGRFSRSYAKEHWPALPPDFDWSYFNAAPSAQQVDHLRGDESLELTNLHPEHSVYRSRLPGLRIRCFVEDTRENGEPRVREATLRLDTLWIDADAEELVLVWRGNPGIRSKEAEEIETLWVVSELLEDEPLPAPEWVQRLQAERDGVEETPQPEPEPPPDDEDAAIQAQLDEQLGQLKDQMIAGGVPPDLLSKLDDPDDLDAFYDGLMAHFGLDPADGERIRAEANAQMAQALKDAGEDPALIEAFVDVEEETADKSALRQLVEARHAAGQSVADEELSGVDLSAAELPGIDLRNAILAEADLSGANLEDADLRGVNLAMANLKGARLARARLDTADASGADFSDADLSGARFDSAIADDALFVGARLAGIHGEGWRATRADFSRADLTSGRLESANFDFATLDETSFAAANLVNASAQTAKGSETDFRGADLTKFRASDGAKLAKGRFDEAVAPDSMWSGSDLTGSSFSSAELPGSDFSGCSLVGTTFLGANLRRANLSKSQLDRAVLADVNLFEGNLYSADVGQADFSGSNLFGAETEDAVFDEAVLDGTDFRRTKREALA